MIPFILKFWKPLSLIGAGLIICGYHFWTLAEAGRGGYARGVRETQAQYASVALKASEAYRATEALTAKTNEGVIDAYRSQIAAIAADRDDGASRLLSLSTELSRSRAAAETQGLAGAAQARYLAGRARELEQATHDYDLACRSDAAQLNALIDEVLPQSR